MSKPIPDTRPFIVEQPYTFRPEPETIQQLWKRRLVDAFFSGGGRRTVKRFQIGHTLEYFYDPKYTVLKDGINEIFAINEKLEPVKLKVGVSFSALTGGGGLKIEVEKATLADLGLTEKSCDILVNKVLGGEI